MSRHYDGDINGRFWFGLQSSNAANRFGVIGQPPEYLEYYFDEDNLEDCKKEIKAIEQELGSNLEILDEYFDINVVDKPIIEMISYHLLAEYADLVLGRKIKNQIEQFGNCNFNAEL